MSFLIGIDIVPATTADFCVNTQKPAIVSGLFALIRYLASIVSLLIATCYLLPTTH